MYLVTFRLVFFLIPFQERTIWMAQLGLQQSLINPQTTFLFRQLNVEKQEKVHITNSVTISDCSQTQRYSGFNK